MFIRMDAVMEWGVGVILWLQGFRPQLDLPFRIVTFMGNESFFLILLPLIYWCVDRRTGIRVSIIFLLSAYVNELCKALAHQPRPFQYDSRVVPVVHADGGGFPSGHTQGAVVVWGYLAAALRGAGAWAPAVCLMVLIPLSRLYLGVHFPTDLLGGYVIGGVLLLLCLRLAPPAESWIVRGGLRWQLFLAGAGPLLLLVLLPEEGSRAAGALWGLGTGFALERRCVGFRADGAWWRRGLRMILGACVLIALWSGLRVTFSAWGEHVLVRFLRYAVVGLWGGLGAPWVFVRLGLAAREAREDGEHRGLAKGRQTDSTGLRPGQE